MVVLFICILVHFIGGVNTGHFFFLSVWHNRDVHRIKALGFLNFPLYSYSDLCLAKNFGRALG